jgi:cell division protein ZapA
VVCALADKVKTVVRISGKEYTLLADLPEEYIHKVAIYVDKKMTEVARQRNNLSTAMVAVMAAINIADEVMELRGEKEAYMKMDRARQPQPQQVQPLRSNVASFKEAKKG